jgi:hypothetical protein
VASRHPETEGDGEAVESLRSSIEAHDRMIADVDRLLSRGKNGAAGETDPAQPQPPGPEPLPRGAG